MYVPSCFSVSEDDANPNSSFNLSSRLNAAFATIIFIGESCNKNGILAHNSAFSVHTPKKQSQIFLILH